MRHNSRRALRAVTIAACVATLGAAFSGVATAASSDQGISDRDVFGSSSEESGSSGSEEETPDVADENLDGETMSPSVHQPGVVEFDTPTFKTAGGAF